MLEEIKPILDEYPTETKRPPLSGSIGASGEMQRHVDHDQLPPQFVPVFSGWRKAVNWLIIAVWLTTLVYFWQWWLQPGNITTWLRFTALSVVLLWTTIIPLYFIIIIARSVRPSPDFPLPAGARVAIVVTKTPSEPWEMVKKTLLGALGQRGIKHDTWLADEDPSMETLDWCRKHGVNVSTRKGVAEYHRPTWPRRTRCKEGNLAFFYDHYGYDRYDFVTQFDADHIPEPDYLRLAIAQFSNPAIGYVSAPSICDSNEFESWSARGRLYFEASLHGALQLGYNKIGVPLCIGSHYSVRTAALRAAGGLGPDLAEDHSTTMLLNAAGWRGVHSIDSIAHGEGPWTFADFATQELQWSRSLATILLTYTPSYFTRLDGRLKFQFVFLQLWYPFLSTITALGFFLPVFALATGEVFANVTYFDFVLHFLPLSIVVTSQFFWLRAMGIFRPQNAKIFRWEPIYFVLLRWPWSLFGTILAVWDRITGKFVDFRITPKSDARTDALPTRVLMPYIVLSLVSALTARLVQHPGNAAGFYILTLGNALIFFSAVVLIMVRHAIENKLKLKNWRWEGLLHAFAVIAMGVAIISATYQNGLKGVAAMNAGITAFTLTQTLSLPAGAAFGDPRSVVVRFKPEWHGFSWQNKNQDEEESP